MANFAKLEITFDSISILGDVLSFDTESGSFPTVIETGANIRTAPNIFSIGKNTADSANGYYLALSLDYGAYCDISIDGNKVTIEATEYIEFLNFSFPSNITYLYTPPVIPVNFAITNILAESATIENRNTHARFNISVINGLSPYQINAPVSKASALESDLYFDYLRLPTLYQDLNISDDNSDVAVSIMPTVDFFTLDDVNVLEAFGGATVTAITTTQSGDISTIKEYSLDNTVWQNGSSYTGLLPGNYTMYVRDNYGAFYSLPFEVIGISVDKPEPYFDIPKANGFRFVPSTVFDCNNIANWDNALLSELFEQGKFTAVEKKCYSQLITDCDSVPTQINTNYDNILVSIVDSEDVEVLEPTATLKTNNINQEDKRDCSFLQATDGKVVVVFGGGNIYFPNTATIKETYTNFNGSLPEFARFGKLFSISGTTDLNGDYEPLEEYFDATNDVWGIKLDVTFISGNSAGICQTIYDELIYNVWDFNTVGSALGSDTYQILISATDDDPRYDTIEWKSEPIKKVSAKSTAVFKYHHKSNAAGIDFSYGIDLILRIPTRFIDGVTSEESQTFVSDYGKKTVQKTINTTSYNLESGLIPFYVVEKIAIASGMSSLMIDGVTYVKGEDAEAETLITQRNPFQKVTRAYQLDDAISIGEAVGIVTQTRTAIGSSSTIAIGDNNA